jgi:putative oxidoreductase
MGTSVFDKEGFGKLFVRVILGMIAMAKGIAFFVQGKGALVAAGNILSLIGINFSPLFFGFCVAIVCVVCGITFAIGAFFKTSAFLLGSVILLDALLHHYTKTAAVDVVVTTIGVAATLYGFVFIGAGPHAVQR